MSIKNASLWLARQFDSGLTPAGVVVGLLIAGSGVGALLALSVGSFWFAALWGLPFLILLGGLFLAGHYTDSSLSMTQTERRDRWNKLPAFAKRGLFILGMGAVAGALLSGAWSYRVSWTLYCVSTLQFAEGVRRTHPPLPDAKGRFVSEADSPAEYATLRKKVLIGLYLLAAIELGFALLAFW